MKSSVLSFSNQRDMPEKKYYVVWKGLKPGVYDTWRECEAQVRGVEGTIYKAFANKDEAEKAFASNWKSHFGMRKSTISDREKKNILTPSLSVDAACSGNPGILEYQGVDTKTGRILFHQGPFPLGTVNIGEFLGIVHALAYLKKHHSDIPVYSDSRTAIKWVKDKAVRTKLPRTEETEALFDLVDRAIVWLKDHDYSNPVLKWETKNWGEIPADFGRK